MPYSSKQLLRLAIPACMCMVVAGCGYSPDGVVVGHAPSHIAPGQEPHYTNYGDRSDKISFHGGDSVAFNRELQTENPWPRHLNRTHIHADGQVIDGAIKRYKSDNVKQGAAATTGSGT